MRRRPATLLACAVIVGHAAIAEAASRPRAAGPVGAVSGPVHRPAAGPEHGAIHLLALNMYHEAKGEGREGMLAVGWVVLNRMADEAFPKTVEGVVFQGCQWSWTCDDRPDAPRQDGAWRQSLHLAQLLLTRPPADPTRGALWFQAASDGDPGRRPQMAPSARIGSHLFYARADRLPRPGAKPGRRLFYTGR